MQDVCAKGSVKQSLELARWEYIAAVVNMSDRGWCDSKGFQSSEKVGPSSSEFPGVAQLRMLLLYFENLMRMTRALSALPGSFAKEYFGGV